MERPFANTEQSPAGPLSWIEEGPTIVLVGGRCAECLQYVFPLSQNCPKCRGSKMRSARLSPRGTLYSYSVVHINRVGYANPYIVGYVDYPEGVRVFGQIEESSDPLVIGVQVDSIRGVIREREDGSRVTSYKFRRASLV